jgi:hypothetical protein
VGSGGSSSGAEMLILGMAASFGEGEERDSGERGREVRQRRGWGMRCAPRRRNRPGSSLQRPRMEHVRVPPSAIPQPSD